MNAIGGMLVSLPVGLAVAVIATLGKLPPTAPSAVLLLLFVSGLLAPGVGRIMTMRGVQRLGPSLQTALQGSLAPTLAVFGGVVIFKEALGVARSVGVIAVIVGVWILSTSKRGSSRDLNDNGQGSTLTPSKAVYPLIAGLAFGGADLLRSAILDEFAYPEFSAMVAFAAAFAAWLVFTATRKTIRLRASIGRGRGWFVLHGILSSAAVLCVFQALHRGDVSLVSPIVAAQPMIVIALSRVFLRDVEILTRRIVVACFVTVGGTVLIMLSV